MALIAVVDDVAPNRELLTTVLQAIGHSTIEAADGAEALRLIREHLPDLVICDILMPVMDGYELAREIRADPALAATPIIFSTAHYTGRESARLADACGVTDFLPKPTEPQQIMEVVGRVLSRPAAAKPEAPAIEAFDRQHLQLMTDQLSQKVADLQVAKQQLETLVDINLQLASQRDAVGLLDSVCRHARSLIGARFATLVVRAVEGENIGHVSHAAGAPGLLAGLGPCRVDDGLLGALVEERRPLRLKASMAKTVDLGLPAGYPLAGAVLAAPISSLSASFGWICLVGKVGGDEFSATDEQLLTILAAQTGRIYENGSLYDRIERHAKALEAQYAVAHILAVSDSLEEAGAGLLESICRTLHFAAGALWQADVAKKTYSCVQAWCHESDSCEDFLVATRKLNLKDPAALPARTWLSNEPTWIPDVARDGGFLRRRQAVAAGLHAIACLPIRARGQVTGVLELLTHQSGEPPPGLMSTLEAIADQIGQFFDSEAQRQRIVRLSRVKAVLGGIHAASAHVHTKTDLFREACRIAVEEGEFGICWIGERDAGGTMVRSLAWAGVSDALGSLPAASCVDPEALRASVVCSALDTAAPAIKTDLGEGAELCPRQTEALRRGYRAVIALPLIVEQAVVGVMVIYAADVESFEGEELDLLTQLANDVAFTLEYIGKQDRLAFLAHHDTLTGLPNRTLLTEVMTQELSKPRLVREKIAVVAFDINRFRHINYTFGRLFGDLLLRELAQRLSTAWPNPAHLAKLATDNFVGMICDVRDFKVVALMLEKVMAEVFDRAFSIGGKEVQISAAAGIAIHPDDGEDAETLMRNAESALRMAKAGGRRLTFYRPEMNAMIADSLMLENRLHRALRNHEFVLHYQPKVDVVTGRTMSFEALIRWNDPDVGLIAPGEFVPMLEETGMIHQVGNWVVAQALADSRRWTEEGVVDSPRIAVNVSVAQLQQSDFIDSLSAAASSTNGASPLDIEITESVMMSDIDGNIGRLRELRDRGLDIAIDDFGTGYSSLSYLIKLPVNALKIDQSFVATMASSPESMTVVTTIISLAHALGMKVVAEGVETEEQAKILRLFKCDELQGFLVSAAMPAGEVAAFLRH